MRLQWHLPYLAPAEIQASARFPLSLVWLLSLPSSTHHFLGLVETWKWTGFSITLCTAHQGCLCLDTMFAHLSVRMTQYPLFSWAPHTSLCILLFPKGFSEALWCRASASWGCTFSHVTEMSLPTAAPPPSPPWGVCPCVTGQGSLPLIHEAFFQIFVRVMRTLSSLHSFTFWIPRLGREPSPPPASVTLLCE